MADTAVIVVDMQRGLVQRARPAYRLDDVVSGINRLTAAARAANAPVCFVQHDGDADDDLPLGHLGDIALCPTVAAAQGAKAGHGTWAELELLTVHGILHLLGYDHAEPAEKAEMWDVQGRLLEAWRAPGNRLEA